jgi:V8-like Glu-specific endopeptidase
MTPPTDARALARQVERAVAAFDSPRTTQLCEELIAQVRSTDEPFPELPARRVLSALRRKREFQLMARVADVLIASGRDGMVTYRQYAQALLDQGLTGAGLGVLAAGMAVGNDVGEQAELQGLIARANKDRYVATGPAAGRRRTLHLERAVQGYHQAWVEDRTRLWHGINAAALLNRAARDGVALAGFPDPQAAADGLAEEILVAVGELSERTPVFDLATAVEANVALTRFEQAHQALDLYLAHPQADAFELASTLRQLTEVWGLTAESEPGSTLLPMLQAELLDRGEGGEVTVGPTDVDNDALGRIDQDRRLQKVFGSERFTTTRWFSNALDRCRAVARIEDEVGDGVGTGFLVEGAGLHPSLPPVVLITNAHVVPKAIQAEDAFLAFRGLEDFTEPGVRVRRVLWSSPSDELDATIVEPEQLPAGVLPCPLARSLPPLNADPRERVYVIGHPLGRPDLQLSILDNHLLDYDGTMVHYRAPTEPGSSGSPVMNKRWAVIALHHSGDNEMPRLHGGGVYEANEGIRIDQIQAALQRDL